MRLYPFFLLGFAGLGAWLGCGSTIDTTEAASGSGGGANAGGHTSSSASASTGPGAGGAGGVASGGGGSATTSGAGGSSDPCPHAYLTISFDGGDPPPVVALNQICSGSWGSGETAHAVGYEGYTGPGPNSMHELTIEGCQGPQGPDQLELDVPLFDDGSAATDSGLFQLSGGQWKTAHGVTVKITSFGALHQLIEGSYDGTMSDGAMQHHVSGSFGVCHVEDFLPP